MIFIIIIIVIIYLFTVDQKKVSYNIIIIYLFTVDQKEVSHNLEKKLTKFITETFSFLSLSLAYDYFSFIQLKSL